MAQTPGGAPSSDESVEAVRRYYDDFAGAEHERLTQDIAGRVSFEIHRQFLEPHLKDNQRILELGAGTGRFTILLTERSSRVMVTDISPVQLHLNEANVTAAGTEHAVEARHTLDIRDTSCFPDGSFDLIVAYGGPLSYAFDDAQQALAGLLRIVKPDGVIVASVMSLWGSWRARLPGAMQLAARFGTDVTDAVIRTGDLRHVPGVVHVCRIFTWEQLATLVHECGGEILAGSASNWASLEDPAILAELERTPQLWERFLTYETAACSSLGTRDGGTHILFAARRNPV
ncbi:class I SAM-dependent methyltransferase [Kitasatospora sp. McL0602]|uniref:class I SAM-dependent methyltransferase n=1 Tax=Kitasatospora sp. McL0602 TaxID=3439530 RepID=UPI003F8B6FEC